MSSLSYSTPRLAVRDSFDDEDVSDDVEDEVFIRDGRNGFKADEERGVKRPLMAPRRKVKCNQFRSETCRNTSCRVMCLPCCYGIIALSSLLGLIMLVVFLIMWFPIPLEQMAFWRVSETSSMVMPCTELVTEYVWTRSLPKLTSESALQVNDVNKDGILDVIIAYGTGADGHDVPDIVCTLYFKGVIPCLGGLLALDGKSGTIIWQHWAPHAVYTVDCGADLTGDNVKDCLATGKGGVLRVVNGNDGSLVWQLEHQQSVDQELQIDSYAGQFIPDIDGDEIQDILAAHTEDSSGGGAGPAVCGHLVLLSGHNGKMLQKLATPGGEETYYAPQILVQMDGELLVLFGTGGHASPGGLYVVPLQQLTLGELLQVKTLYKDPFKGVMSPPALADINQDGIEDIVVATFNSSVLAFDGHTFQLLWNFTFPNSETFSVPTPGYFNNDDIPDFLVKYQTGPGSPVYYYTQTAVLDGRTGNLLLDSMLIDTAGSQMAGLSISIEGFGNDLFLHWQADCVGFEGAKDAFAFWQGDSIQAQSRADLCKLRFNSTLATNFLALSQHLPPPGISIYSSEQHKDVEFGGMVNTSFEIHKYLDEHPDFWDIYRRSKTYSKVFPNQLSPEKKEYNVEGMKSGGSNFRHKQDPPLTDNEPGYYYSEDYALPNRGRNRNLGVGEGEEVLPVFPGNTKYPDVRKHGSEFPKHTPINGEWRQQWQNSDLTPAGGNLVPEGYLNNLNPTSGLFENAIPSHDPDYDMLYDPSSEESYNRQQAQRDERKVEAKGRRLKGDRRGERRRKKKRETDVKQTTFGIQRLTSAGVLAPSLSNDDNDSIDVIFATYWIPPSYDAHILQPKDLDCLRSTQITSKDGTGNYPDLVKDFHGTKDCQEIKRKVKKEHQLASDIDSLIINMGQMTVYRVKLNCQCQNLVTTEKCSVVLPFNQQSWPTGTGIGGNGYFKARDIVFGMKNGIER
ncbi:uncharacterized protein [Anabrus simplex]|uniref:uncharacterized protein n=1 Tax=Anabrus simplex TaxID=316456 RepID=UPI0035A35F40